MDKTFIEYQLKSLSAPKLKEVGKEESAARKAAVKMSFWVSATFFCPFDYSYLPLSDFPRIQHCASLLQGPPLHDRGPRQTEGAAIVRYLEGLNDWLEAEVVLGNRDLPGACEHSLVHGVLLATRYTMEELDWRSDAVVAAAEDLRLSLKRLLGLILRVTALALWVVSVNALNLKELEKGPENVEGLGEGVRKVQMYGDGGVETAGREGGGESESEREESDEESLLDSDSEGEESDDDRSGGVPEARGDALGGSAYSRGRAPGVRRRQRDGPPRADGNGRVLAEHERGEPVVGNGYQAGSARRGAGSSANEGPRRRGRILP